MKINNQNGWEYEPSRVITKRELWQYITIYNNLRIVCHQVNSYFFRLMLIKSKQCQNFSRATIFVTYSQDYQQF